VKHAPDRKRATAEPLDVTKAMQVSGQGRCGRHRLSVFTQVSGHMAVQAGAVCKTARFADPHPFCPVTGTQDCSADWRLPRILVGWFFAVLLTPGSGLAVVVPWRAAGSARAISSSLHGEDDRMCAAATGMEDQHGAVASGAVLGSGRRGEPRRHAAKVPGVPGQGLDRAEPVMYLSWTGDGPVMYLSYTCAGDVPDHQAAVPARGRCEPCARSADVDLAEESGASIGVVPRYRPGQDRAAGSGHPSCQ